MEKEVKKKLFIKSYGCQMNVYDSLKMSELLQPFGYETSDSPDDADMVVLNTCHIREKAAEKVYSELGRMKAHKEAKKASGSDMIIAVAGCVGQAEGEEIFKRASCVDIVVGPQSYHNLPTLITEAARKKGKVINLDFAPEPKFDSLMQDTASQGVSAFLSIQEGCNEFCKFCVVPYTRGAEFSRPVHEIYRETTKLVSLGAIEITLLGQNVNGYNGAGLEGEASSLGQLVKYLAKIDQIKRIRYMTSHPRSMFDDLIEAHGSEEKLMPFLHLPIQSGSDKILKSMNRKHTVSEYMHTIEKLLKVRPDMAFSSDFIVGYPGETDEDFKQTVKIVEDIGYAQCYSFKYSPRPGTPASIMENQVDEKIKSERLAILQEVITSHQEKFNRSSIGKTMEVLFDRTGKFEGQLLGKSPYMQSVYINDSSKYHGQLVKVEITQAFQNSLSGIVIDDELSKVA
ncbi:MAG: tRNA (N6-isopentenyl adenosine(37)-C2)-methylthiotransferase MiaB [Alphaproteobacteria bacterium]